MAKMCLFVYTGSLSRNESNAIELGWINGFIGSLWGWNSAVNTRRKEAVAQAMVSSRSFLHPCLFCSGPLQEMGPRNQCCHDV